MRVFLALSYKQEEYPKMKKKILVLALALCLLAGLLSGCEIRIFDCS